MRIVIEETEIEMLENNSKSTEVNKLFEKYLGMCYLKDRCVSKWWISDKTTNTVTIVATREYITFKIHFIEFSELIEQCYSDKTRLTQRVLTKWLIDKGIIEYNGDWEQEHPLYSEFTCFGKKLKNSI